MDAELLDKLRNAVSLISSVLEAAEPKKEATRISLESVRAILAKKAGAGYGNEVRDLIVKFGAQRLSEVPEDKYSELMMEAEGIGNA